MPIRFSHAGIKQAGGFGLQTLSDDDLERIHLASLDVLWDLGYKVKSPQAREILADHGCLVHGDSEIVHIPPHLVEDAIHSTPPTYRAHGLDPANDYLVGGKRTGFVNFGEAPMLMDPRTRGVRAATRRDVDDTVHFINALDNIVGWERPLTPQDVDEEMASIYNAYSFFTNSSKHGFLGIYSVEQLEAAICMGSVVAGGEEVLKNRPTFTCSADPVSPLVLTAEAAEVLIEACRFGIPVKINPLGLMGATTCATLAGTLVTHNAEVLGAVTLGQLVRRGAPMVYGSSTSIMDMRTTISAMGAPEMAMLSAAVAKLAHMYNIPSWVGAG